MTVVDAQSVSKQFLLRHNATVELKVRFLSLLHSKHRQSIEEFWALKNVSLRVQQGEAIGLVGRNGSGKSTLLKLIAAIHRPTTGRMLVRRGAKISSMIELGVGFHPELTGRENVFLNAAIHGLNRSAIESIYDAVVDYSGLAHFIDVPIKNYSSGMHMRLGFAIAANLDPEILLLDEIFAVGDADFQQRCTATVKTFLSQGKTLMFVSHSSPAIRSICRRVCVLERGELAFDGDLERGLAFYERQLGRETGPTLVPAAGDAGTRDALTSETDEDRTLSAVSDGQMARWQIDFLREHGLESRHRLLDVGCGNLAAAVQLLPFLERGHYWGFERDPALLEAGIRVELPRAGLSADLGHFIVNETFELNGAHGTFDFALANSLFSSLPFNSVARCIAAVVRKLSVSGRFYATLFENPDPQSFEPIFHGNGMTTYADREPYHYPFRLLVDLCESLGASVERLDTSTHPRGERVVCIKRVVAPVTFSGL